MLQANAHSRVSESARTIIDEPQSRARANSPCIITSCSNDPGELSGVPTYRIPAMPGSDRSDGNRVTPSKRSMQNVQHRDLHGRNDFFNGRLELAMPPRDVVPFPELESHSRKHTDGFEPRGAVERDARVVRKRDPGVRLAVAQLD